MPDPSADLPAHVADQLADRLDEVVGQLVATYREQLPSYRGVAERAVVENTRAMFDVVVRQLRRGGEPGDEAADEVRQLARRWVSTDIPVGEVSRSFQVGAYGAITYVRGLAATGELTAELADLAQDLAWKWTLLGTSVLAEVEREQAVAEARRDATRLTDFVAQLVTGSITLARLSEEAEAFGLDLTHPYHAVCARPPDRAALPALERVIRESGASDTHRVVQAVHDGRLLAVTPQRPRAPEGSIVAVGPPATLAEIASSFQEAEQVLATASAFAVFGLVDLPALGPLTLVALTGDAARRLEAHHFSDLPPGFDEVEETVFALLERDGHVEQLAADLHLHRNSVRHRLNRFRDATGLDVRRNRDLVIAWWLLTWREQRRRDAR